LRSSPGVGTGATADDPMLYLSVGESPAHASMAEISVEAAVSAIISGLTDVGN
jgi:hypothetical protein